METFRAARQLAETNLANTRLMAPFAGYISQRNLDNGAAVSAQSAGTNTTSVGILVLQDIGTVKLQIEVPERDISRVMVGARGRASPRIRTRGRSSAAGWSGWSTASIRAPAPWVSRWTSRIPTASSSPVCSPGRRSLVDTRKGALTIPLEALRVGEARPSVMVVKGGIVEPVIVELGLTDSRVVEVRQGLSEQDQVILQGKDLVKARQKVRTVPATGSSARHVADPHRHAERHRHPHGLPGHRGARGHLARQDADRPLPEHQLPVDPDRHRLQGRQRPGRGAHRDVPDREGGVRGGDVRYVESRSRQGFSVVTVQFVWGSDLDAGSPRSRSGSSRS